MAAGSPSGVAAGRPGSDGVAGLEVVVPQVFEPRGSASSGRAAPDGAERTRPGAIAAAAAGEPTAATGAASEASGPGSAVGEAEADFVRRTTATRLLQLACVAVFAAQWAPVAQSLAAGAAGGAAASGREVALAVLLVCPPTQLTLEWQADAIALASGQLGSLFTSALLHSGVISLLASLVSLEETAPWLETMHGFMIMLISYFMAGAGAALAQMCVGGQPAGIGGIGAVLGMEAAVAVRVFRFTGEPLPPTAACLATCAVGLLMALYQPLVGPWGIIGGVLGGALSGVLAFEVLWMMRVVLGVSILLGLGAWNLATWLPRALWRLLAAAASLVVGTVLALVQAVRGV
ncbi:hypothetical protein GPECTOR_3g284 [Gonium pectorale]|uniref:Peptidase S54 rhomboid domain-containing protein n=1 Tax=Gonium pectorale TaxID=33097 RepID=A0A150GZE8_GONPE|nr:hypothetical protein GPECTOR_3g284 [Gonium pectorale]|eukprot:KXZ55133.1 hypothetical protein GPECTOR_3g284 [Gonium pectorale]